MKRISFFLLAFVFCTAPVSRAQDARTEERINKLTGQVEDLVATLESQKKTIRELMREIETLREQIGKPNTSYATQDDLRRVSKNLEEVDRKRVEDAKKVETTLANLGKQLTQNAPKDPDKHNSGRKKGSGGDNSGADKPEKPAPPEKGYDYTIKSGDTLSAIIAAYKEQGIRISDKDILKANPGLVPERMKPGQKIFIPAPQKERASE